MKGILYGVGVGPGDPQLLTLKAISIIEKCKVIAVPTTGKQNNIALKIISEYVEGKEILECFMPMTYDEKELAKYHQEASEKICKMLEQEIDVCFVTLGDPSIYATYSYLHNIVSAEGYTTELVPGVPSFCAAAAALNISLCENNTPLHIIPSSYSGEALDLDGTKVLMKAGKNIHTVIDKIQEKGLLSDSMMVEKCGMNGEKIYSNLHDAKGETSYFSTIIVKS